MSTSIPLSHEAAGELAYALPKAIPAPLVSIMGGNWPRVVKLDADNYLIHLADQKDRTLRYGFMNREGFEALLGEVNPMRLDDYEYPCALATAIDKHCYFASARRWYND